MLTSMTLTSLPASLLVSLSPGEATIKEHQNWILKSCLILVNILLPGEPKENTEPPAIVQFAQPSTGVNRCGPQTFQGWLWTFIWATSWESYAVLEVRSMFWLCMKQRSVQCPCCCLQHFKVFFSPFFQRLAALVCAFLAPNSLVSTGCDDQVRPIDQSLSWFLTQLDSCVCVCRVFLSASRATKLNSI